MPCYRMVFPITYAFSSLHIVKWLYTRYTNKNRKWQFYTVTFSNKGIITINFIIVIV